VTEDLLQRLRELRTQLREIELLASALEDDDFAEKVWMVRAMLLDACDRAQELNDRDRDLGEAVA
jgi:hypothetical protein